MIAEKANEIELIISILPNSNTFKKKKPLSTQPPKTPAPKTPVPKTSAPKFHLTAAASAELEAGSVACADFYQLTKLQALQQPHLQSSY